jgi:hypothetical protein
MSPVNAVVIFIIILALISMVLGAPTKAVERDSDNATRTDKPIPPQFLINLHSCIQLKNKGKLYEAMECLKFADKNSHHLQNIITEIKTVWGFVGHWLNDEILSFKISKHTLKELIYSVDLQFYKKALSSNQKTKLLKSGCYSQKGISLKLILSNTTNTVNLTQSSLNVTEWIGFHQLKDWYTSWLHKVDRDGNYTNSKYFELQLKPFVSCKNVSLVDIGVSSLIGYQPLLVVYTSASDIDKDLNFTFAQKIKNSPDKRVRSATSASSGQTDLSGRCRLIPFSIPYELIQSVSPGTFSLNYCDGKCPYPLENDINHANAIAYFSAVPDHVLPVKPKPPCCVPIKYTLIDAIMPADNGSYYVLTTFHDITATECGCR